jgi:hypothetical protein
LQNRLGEVVTPGDDALHVVFLILDRAEEDGIGQIHHFGNAAPCCPKKDSLGFRRAVDDVVGRAEVLADQVGLVLVEGPLEVGGEEPVHDVHAGGEGELGDAAQDEGLVGGLLGVFAHDHDPAGVERAVDVVMAAMDVEGVLGESASTNLQHHGGTLAGGVVILLDAVDNALARGEVDHAFAADRMRNSAALGRVLAFRLNGYRIVAKDVEVAFGIGLLKQLAALGGGGDGVEHAGVGDTRLGVVRDELVSVCGNTNAWITRSGHKSLSGWRVRPYFAQCRSL